MSVSQKYMIWWTLNSSSHPPTIQELELIQKQNKLEKSWMVNQQSKAGNDITIQIRLKAQ